MIVQNSYIVKCDSYEVFVIVIFVFHKHILFLLCYLYPDFSIICLAMAPI